MQAVSHSDRGRCGEKWQIQLFLELDAGGRRYLISRPFILIDLIEQSEPYLNAFELSCSTWSTLSPSSSPLCSESLQANGLMYCHMPQQLISKARDLFAAGMGLVYDLQYR